MQGAHKCEIRHSLTFWTFLVSFHEFCESCIFSSTFSSKSSSIFVFPKPDFEILNEHICETFHLLNLDMLHETLFKCVCVFPLFEQVGFLDPDQIAACLNRCSAMEPWPAVAWVIITMVIADWMETAHTRDFTENDIIYLHPSSMTFFINLIKIIPELPPLHR